MAITSHARHWKPLLFFVVVYFTTTTTCIPSRDSLELDVYDKPLLCSDIADDIMTSHKILVVDVDRKKTLEGVRNRLCHRPKPRLPIELSYSMASRFVILNSTETLAKSEIYCSEGSKIISCSCDIFFYTGDNYDITLHNSWMDTSLNKCECEYKYDPDNFERMDPDVTINVMSMVTCGKNVWESMETNKG